MTKIKKTLETGTSMIQINSNVMAIGTKFLEKIGTGFRLF